MAKEGKVKAFWKWFASNPIWDFVKWVGGTAIVTSIWTVLKTEFHHHPVDWILFLFFVTAGVILVAIALRFQPKQEEFVSPVRSDAQSLPATSAGAVVAFGGRDTLEEAQEEHARVFALGNQLDGVFSSLQVEAVRLASDLETFMKRIGDRPSTPPGSDWDGIFGHAVHGEGGKWFVRMQAEYRQDYSPRINAYIGKLERETGRTNSRLRAYSDHVHDFSNINTVRAQLWKEAMYPLTIDFAGE